jgi:hypothetical protein
MLNAKGSDGIVDQRRLGEADGPAGKALAPGAQGQVLSFQRLQQVLGLQPLPLVEAVLVGPPAVGQPAPDGDAGPLEQGQQAAEEWRGCVGRRRRPPPAR